MGAVRTPDFLDPEFIENPYPTLAELRLEDPVHFGDNGIWLLTRHEDVHRLNRDPRLGRDLRKWFAYGALRPYLADSELERCVEQWMFSLDPPEHTRLRRLVARAFTPAAIDKMQATVEAVVDDLLAAVEDRESFDFVEKFARPFPLRVIARILGIPSDEHESLAAWTDKLSRVVEPIARRREKEAANAATIELSEYIGAHAERRRVNKTDDVLSTLLAEEEDGDKLSHAELISNVILLFIAGHETTTHLLGNALVALHAAPDQMELLRREPDLMKRATEEFLRFDGPANVNARVAHEVIEVGGKTIEPGQLAFCMLGAANRDPSVFSEPDRLDVTRDPNPHTAFGGGAHFCIGAPLARMEVRIGMERLLRRYRNISVDTAAARRKQVVNLRGFESLPVRVQRSA